jgi:hypothetical protein
MPGPAASDVELLVRIDAMVPHRIALLAVDARLFRISDLRLELPPESPAVLMNFSEFQ